MKELDKIIKDKLINYEEDPSPEFWRRLNARLTRPRIISGILFIFVLMAGILFWLLLPKLDAEMISEPNTIKKYEIPTNDPEIKNINNPTYKQEIEEQADNTSTFSIPKNDNELLVVSKSIVEEDKKIQEVNIEYSKQSHKIKLENWSVINAMESKSISKIYYDVESQNHINKKKAKFGYNSAIEELYSCKKFSLSLELGRNVSWKSLSGDPQFQEFIDYREANEEVTSNTLFGIKFNYHIKNWVISSGLTYTTIGEKLNYRITETIVEPNGGYFLVDTIWASIYDPEIGWEPMVIGYDRTWVEEYVSEEINYKIENINTYSYFEIPILIAYNFSKGRFSIRPAIGVSLGLLYSASGKLPTINPPDFSELNGESVYLKPMLCNLIFDLSFEYSINQNYGIFIKPFYKKGLNSIYKNYPLSGNYNNAGLKIGINICL